MREIVTLQIGQCGNQIGRRFWAQALQEHAASAHGQTFEECMSSFFRNVDSRGRDIPVHPAAPISHLRARALLIDMEQGVVNETMRSPLGELFDAQQQLTDVSGSGNNWAHGYNVYGSQYAETTIELVRRLAEQCDSLQSFFVVHSLGGGTGSGFGTRLMEILQEQYPQVYRFCVSVFPSEDDDVVTSPYNSILSMSRLIHCADCVLPVHNQALQSMVETAQAASRPVASRATDVRDTPKPKPFDAMNNIVAHCMLNLTASARFGGSLNVDLNELTTNLVPYPRMHFLTSSFAPVTCLADVGMLHRGIDTMFQECLSPPFQLTSCDPRSSTYLCAAFLVRGAVTIADVQRNLATIKQGVRMASWNPDGFKIGICEHPPLGFKYGLTTVSNNCAIKNVFSALHGRFAKLFRRHAHLHHYEQYIERDMIESSARDVVALMDDYARVDSTGAVGGAGAVPDAVRWAFEV